MSLPVFQATIVNQAGDIIPSPVITVIDEATGLPASLFSDRNGTFPLGTNGVFTGGTDGFAQFFAASGNYRVKAELASAGFEQTWDFVAMVGDAAFYQVGSGASQIPTNALLPNFGTAAEADVQTSPTDATVGALLNNETTHIGGNLNYTGANLNPNVFGGAGFVADGWAHTATEARILLRTLSDTDAISMTLGGGTFDVAQGTGIVSGGDNTTSLVLGSSALITGGCTIIQVVGLSGMTTNEPIQLFGNAANSTITVNF